MGDASASHSVGGGRGRAELQAAGLLPRKEGARGGNELGLARRPSRAAIIYLIGIEEIPGLLFL